MDWQLATILAVTFGLLTFATWDLIVAPLFEEPDDE